MSTNKMIANMNSAAAVVKMPGNHYCAVKIEKTPDGVKLLYKHTGETEDINDILKTGGLSLSKTKTVLGIDPHGVAFYNIAIPKVPDAQLEAIVKMQAENLLPLPLDQMEIAYRRGKVIADKCLITIAAGRSSQLKKEMHFAKDCGISRIVLTCEGTAKAFDTLFDIPQQKYVILNVRKDDTQVLLCENHKLTHASRLDLGADDLARSDSACGDMFISDLRNALDLFGTDAAEENALYVFSESNSLAETITTGLNQAKIDAKTALLKPNSASEETSLDENEIHRYLEALGCALLTLDEENPPLDLFSDLNNPDKAKKKSSAAAPLIKAAVIFAVMLLITVFTLNHLNKLELAMYDNDKIEQLVKEQNIRKFIASQRPDILELIKEINENTPDGMTIDSIDFKKGQKVTIASKAAKHAQIMEIENFLAGKKGISNVIRLNPTFDKQKKTYEFKINFHYKNWTRR